MSNSKEDSQRETGKVAVPIVEERVELGKRTLPGRSVTVTTTPVTERKTVSQPVVREEVSVARVPIGKVIDTVPQVREEGELTVIPVVEERITVTKELVLTEEIHLRRTRSEVIDEQVVELTRTRVEISE